MNRKVKQNKKDINKLIGLGIIEHLYNNNNISENEYKVIKDKYINSK